MLRKKYRKKIYTQLEGAGPAGSLIANQLIVFFFMLQGGWGPGGPGPQNWTLQAWKVVSCMAMVVLVQVVQIQVNQVVQMVQVVQVVQVLRTGPCRRGRWSPAWPRCCCCPAQSPAAAAAAAGSPGTSRAWHRGQRSGSGSPEGQDRPVRGQLPPADPSGPPGADLLLWPAALGFQQGVQDRPQGGALLPVVSADHVVGRAHTPEEERVHRGESSAPWQVDQVHVEHRTFSTITRRRSPGAWRRRRRSSRQTVKVIRRSSEGHEEKEGTDQELPRSYLRMKVWSFQAWSLLVNFGPMPCSPGWA